MRATTFRLCCYALIAATAAALLAPAIAEALLHAHSTVAQAAP